MFHGVESYFREIRRNQRRVVLGTLILHGIALALLLATQIPAVHSVIFPPRRRLVRFGYEGPNRYVENIVLAPLPGTREPLRDVGKVETRAARRGGDERRMSDDGEPAQTPPMLSLPGFGDSEASVIARARSNRPNVPVVQSEDLVIERMDPPLYPEDLRAQGIEGRVAVMALIDTTGQVAEVLVVSSTGFSAFERSVLDAVREARFRPYRNGGEAEEVYALMRYRFRIY